MGVRVEKKKGERKMNVFSSSVIKEILFFFLSGETQRAVGEGT